jgi:hypothetical protein
MDTSSESSISSDPALSTNSSESSLLDSKNIDTSTNGPSGLRILYITLIIIVGFILLWILIVFLTQEPPAKILDDMVNAVNQIQPSSDFIPPSQ